jgi:hypothetical protein
MSGRVWPYLLAGLAIAGTLLAAETAGACSVPVFRYALERWAPDPYEIVVFHRGALSAADQAIVDEFKARATDLRAPANLRVHEVDLSGPLPDEVQALWDAQENPTLPWTVVLYPVMAELDDVIWAGPLSHSAIEPLVDSPKRREVARRLLEGDSIVWVLLECGDKTRDDQAATSLATQLEQLEEILELPVVEEIWHDPGAGGDVFATLGPESMLSTLPLELSFSTVRVARDEPGEEMFVRMLAHSEPDLVEFAEHPMAFPVFGRGRALYALVGRGINQRTMQQAGLFLTGACSCLVKSLNPGTDLLMAVDWEGGLTGGRLTEMAAFAPVRPVVPAARPPLEPLDAVAAPITKYVLIALGAALALAGAATFAVVWRHARRRRHSL